MLKKLYICGYVYVCVCVCLCAYTVVSDDKTPSDAVRKRHVLLFQVFQHQYHKNIDITNVYFMLDRLIITSNL